MSAIEVFDPALKGLADIGAADADPELLRMSAVLDALFEAGFPISYHRLGEDPEAFERNGRISSLLAAEGPSALPAVFVDGALLSKGAYPATEAIGDALGVVFVAADEAGCCGGGCGCGGEDGCGCGGGCCGGHGEEKGCGCGGC